MNDLLMVCFYGIASWMLAMYLPGGYYYFVHPARTRHGSIKERLDLFIISPLSLPYEMWEMHLEKLAAQKATASEERP